MTRAEVATDERLRRGISLQGTLIGINACQPAAGML
jgi:hypothetical protein